VISDYLAIGLMSGTSMDGVDAALIETDGEGLVDTGPGITLAYPPDLVTLIREAAVTARTITDRLARPEPLATAERRLTELHAETVHRLLSIADVKPREVDLIGFHGQTVLHRPEAGLTIQLGDGPLLASMTGIDTVADFRAADVAAGGQGAPLAPAFHRALAGRVGDRPVVFLNIGGVANLTFIGADGTLSAFDTGPGNALIDDWVRARTGASCDVDGELAARGSVDHTVLTALLDDDYFGMPPPKSLDRDHFAGAALDGLSLEDGAATLTAFTAAGVARAIAHLPAAPRLWIACGGGRHNTALMAALRRYLPGRVVAAEDAGVEGDYVEAHAFGYLAVRSLKRLPLSWPSTTGVPSPLTGGVLCCAPGR